MRSQSPIEPITPTDAGNRLESRPPNKWGSSRWHGVRRARVRVCSFDQRRGVVCYRPWGEWDQQGSATRTDRAGRISSSGRGHLGQARWSSSAGPLTDNRTRAYPRAGQAAWTRSSTGAASPVWAPATTSAISFLMESSARRGSAMLFHVGKSLITANAVAICCPLSA
jgi:hypothetical protein